MEKTKEQIRHLSNKIEFIESTIKGLQKRIKNLETEKIIENLRRDNIDVNFDSQVIKVSNDSKMDRQEVLRKLWDSNITYYIIDDDKYSIKKGWYLMKGEEEWIDTTSTN